MLGGRTRQPDSVVAHVVDRTRLLHDLDRPRQALGICLLGGQQGEELLALRALGMSQRMHGDHSALALGDIAAEVLCRGFLAAHEVEEVVLELEGEAGRHAVCAQDLDLFLGAAAHDGADRQGHGSGVEGGLVLGHAEVVLHRDVEAGIARPADVHGLALDGARGHVDQLLENPDLDAVLELVVIKDAACDEREREVARVNGEALPHGDVHAGLAATQLRLVCDVVMDEGGGVEVLDRCRRAHDAPLVPANSPAGEHRNQRAVALAPVL